MATSQSVSSSRRFASSSDGLRQGAAAARPTSQRPDVDGPRILLAASRSQFFGRSREKA
jgi:hypothetical protein